MRLNDDYVKITYQTPPIGPSKIVLYLTTFDIEKYKKDQEVETKTKSLVFEEPDNLGYNSFADIRNSLDNRLYGHSIQQHNMNYYEPYVEELKRTIDVYKAMLKTTPAFYNVEDVINCHEVHCNNIKGDLINCKVYKGGKRE